MFRPSEQVIAALANHGLLQKLTPKTYPYGTPSRMFENQQSCPSLVSLLSVLKIQPEIRASDFLSKLKTLDLAISKI